MSWVDGLSGDCPSSSLHGGCRAVFLALSGCRSDDVACAGMSAVAQLYAKTKNRPPLDEVGACPLNPHLLGIHSKSSQRVTEGCRAIAALAGLSYFNRTTLGLTDAADAVCEACTLHSHVPYVQRWELCAIVALVTDCDPSRNAMRITQLATPALVAHELARSPLNAPRRAEGLGVFARIAAVGSVGIHPYSNGCPRFPSA